MIPNDHLTDRALAIADECMLAQLTSHCMRGDDGGVTWIPICNGSETAFVAHADDPIQEAVEWLVARSLCTIVTTDDDEEVIVLTEAAT